MGTNQNQPISAEILLAHADFLRALCRGLLGNDNEAEDVFQETWLVAIRGGPRFAGPIRAWLAGVARNLALTTRRANAARSRRESRAIRPTASPSLLEITEREETRRTVLSAVLSLEEPYRSTIVCRYYEGLSPREIAVNTETPVETVRTRLKRGLARLRRRLDALHAGDQRVWSLALLPLAALRESAAVAPAAGGITGAILMSTKAKLILGAAAAVLLLLGVAIQPFGGGRTETPSARDEELTADHEPGETTGGGTHLGQEGTSGAEPASEETPAAPDFGTPGLIAGTVRVTGTETPIQGVRLVLRFDRSRSRWNPPDSGIVERVVFSDARGRFRFEDLPQGAYTVNIEHRDFLHSAVAGLEVTASTGIDDLAVALGRVEGGAGWIHGSVIDEAGTPVVGALLVVHTAPPGLRVETRSDARGLYRVDRLPPGRYSVSLVDETPGGDEGALWNRTLSTDVKVDRGARLDFAGSGVLRGIALDGNGRPMADVLIVLSPIDESGKGGERRAQTGSDGRFKIEDPGSGTLGVVVGGPPAGAGHPTAYFSAQVATVELTGSDQEIEVRLARGRVSGRLRCDNSKSPASRGLRPTLFLFPAKADEPAAARPVATAMPDRQGKYWFLGLPPGQYRLVVSLKGYSPVQKTLDLAAGEQVEDFDLVLERTPRGSLRVQAKDDEGKAVERLALSIRGQDGRWKRLWPEVESPGIYLAKELPAGKLVLRLFRADLQPLDVPVTVRKGVTEDVEVTLQPRQR